METIEARRITNAFLVPAVLAMMCAVPGVDERDFSSLRSIAYGASPITSAALTRAVRRSAAGSTPVPKPLPMPMSLPLPAHRWRRPPHRHPDSHP